MKAGELKRLPSEYFYDHVYMTFQDDWVAFKMCRLDETPMHRMLCWASDFPHTDSTYPLSSEVLADQFGNARTTSVSPGSAPSSRAGSTRSCTSWCRTRPTVSAS